MVRKWFLIGIVAALFVAVAPLQAGGCCLVMTLDTLPGDVRTGKEVQIGLMMRINQMPLSGQHPFLFAENSESGQKIEVAAEAGDTPGHYIATMVFPEDGVWHWELRASQSGFGQELPPLTVLPSTGAATVAGAPTATAVADTVRVALRWAALALALVAALMLLHDRQQRRAPIIASTQEWGEA